MTLLSPPLFEAACKAFVERGHGWAWVEHAAGGYMFRIVPLQRRAGSIDPPEPAEDPATAAPAPDHLSCYQSVVLSPTFQVPTFYFFVYESSGSPLGLTEIVRTSLLRRHALDGMETTPFSIGDPTSNFPLISFGDHPLLGSQCWYLHPCETHLAVEEMLVARADACPEEDVQWLDAWFVVLSSVVNLGP